MGFVLFIFFAALGWNLGLELGKCSTTWTTSPVSLLLVCFLESVSYFYLFIFFAVLEFELRTLCLLGKHSTTLSHSASLLFVLILPGLGSEHDPALPLEVVGMTGVCLHAWPYSFC
jgi:hypothetical protein